VRDKPKGFKPAIGAQWLCAAVEVLLGERDLSNVPALMSGFCSILDYPRASDFAPAVFTLRQMGVAAASEIQLRQAVHDAVGWEDEHQHDDDHVEPPYEIDPELPHYPFRRRPGTDHIVAEMVTAMTRGLPFSTWSLPVADPTRPMHLMTSASEGAERITVDMAAIPAPPEPPRHDLTRRPRGPIDISLADLQAIAVRLDAHDAANPQRPRGNWLSRLCETTGERKFQVLAPNRATGLLTETDTIRLDGLKHLIGLPGTGKTTLIILLLIWLDENGYRTVVLLPSIEASLNLLGDLRSYGADVGLLVGQAPQTRIEHARKLAERIAADETRGFGRTAPGADLLALNCALGAFDTDPDGGAEFPHLAPPCISVKQRGLKQDGTPKAQETNHKCPVSGWCGRLKAPRELSQRRIWLGHVLSMDTRISPHFADEQLRYFEAAAMTADLIIVDEADGAQQVLDRKAISSLDLTGSEDSYEHALNRDLFTPLSAGRNDMTASNVRQYSMSAADFRELNHSLVVQLHRDRQRNGAEGPMARFKDTFVTGNNVISALFCPEDISVLPPPERLAEERRFNAIRAFWDGCVRAAMSRRTDVDGDVDQYDFEPDQVALALGRTRDEVERTGIAIAALVRDWIAEPLPTRKDRIIDKMREATFALIEPRANLGPEHRVELFRFLVGVTTVIMQFLALVPAQQAMVAEGIHHAPLFRQGISEDFARVVPEALIGRLSGIRFHHDDGSGRPSVRLQYVTFRGAPRTLLYRLHHLLRHDGQWDGERGPNVLLSSATSFLAESPTFHIPVGPDLVLRRNGADVGWRDSEYIFAPIRDPEEPTRTLRFSGALMGVRDRILRKMVDHYFRGEDPLALAMTRDFDAGRKVGLVVNSYAQVRLVKDHLRRTRPDLATRVVAVIDQTPPGNEGDWITAAQVERLGQRDDWDVLVFPMKALARGVNIVFEQGPRRRDALLGTLVFLIRPHPATESLDLVAGLAGAATLAFDTTRLPPGMPVAAMAAAWRTARRQLMSVTRRLLRFPVQASRLGPLAEPFTADIMVDVLQTIGRVMRNGCKARVIFADAAWAPVSASDAITKRDGRQTSMLVMMRDILRARVNDPDPVDREVYRALYEPFLDPLENCAGVRFPDGAAVDDE
jgi:hypothetical protein